MAGEKRTASMALDDRPVRSSTALRQNSTRYDAITSEERGRLPGFTCKLPLKTLSFSNMMSAFEGLEADDIKVHYQLVARVPSSAHKYILIQRLWRDVRMTSDDRSPYIWLILHRCWRSVAVHLLSLISWMRYIAECMFPQVPCRL